MKVQNPHPYPVDVPGGPVLSTAETTEVDESVDLTQAIAIGRLVEVRETKTSKKGNK